MEEPCTILITGIMAAGKSTVAQHLAGRLEKSVHLRGDAFRRMIVNGRLEMETPFSEAAFEQLKLRYRVAAAAAGVYCSGGFTVVYQDIIIGPVLADVVEMLKQRCPTYVVVLCPSPEIVARREAARPKVGYTSWTPAMLDDELRSSTPRLGLWLDTSDLPVDATVDSILAQLAKAHV